MELPSHEGEMPLPLNISYARAPPLSHNDKHLIPHDHHHHHHESHVANHKRMVRYKECLKNHAASMGGNVRDGCGEFMPSGEEGSLEALKCSVCNCHRNFHRKEIEGEPSSFGFYHTPPLNRVVVERKLSLGHHQKPIVGPMCPESLGYPTTRGIVPSTHVPPPPPPPPPNPIMMSYNVGPTVLPSDSDDQEDGGGVGGGVGVGEVVKRRQRTKFTREQKEKMVNFAEKVGWKMQGLEEGVVQNFCQEIGVKRRVFKVWMHNNKHHLAKTHNSTNAPLDQV